MCHSHRSLSQERPERAGQYRNDDLIRKSILGGEAEGLGENIHVAYFFNYFSMEDVFITPTKCLQILRHSHEIL